jgi:hypothetical protein
MDGTLLQLFLLALAAALWPLLIAVVVVALRLPHPARLLSAFLAGALLTTVVLGMVIVRALQASRLTTSSRSTASAAVDFTVAVLLLLTAFILRRRHRTAPTARSGPSWSERALGRGAALAFVAGIVLDIVPGFVPFVALNEIAQLHYSFAASLGLVIAFYLVMFVLIEVPLVGYLVSPERTAVLATRFNEWLTHNFLRIAIGAADVTAAFLIVRGAVKLIRG